MKTHENSGSEIDFSAFYNDMSRSVESARSRYGRPLTLTEKILLSHLFDRETLSSPAMPLPVRGKDNIALLPDRVAMQDPTAQMAMLQYMQAGLGHVKVPSSIHCDHLIRAKSGARIDLVDANSENVEVYEFLRSAAAAHGIAFGAPGKGIIHQVILENLAFPGGLMVGTDSHTPNAGGLAMLAIGVGGADAVEVMAGEPWSLTWPKLIGVKLSGKLSGWASPKDIILKLAGIIGADGGTGAIIEYFGDGTAHLGATGQATIANMGAELGATTSVFPYSELVGDYLKATGRGTLADLCDKHIALLKPDSAVETAPAGFFDRLIEIDLSTLEPHIVGPFTPDLARPLSQFAAEAKAKGWPLKLSYALIGSCTNSSYEDMGRAAHIARQAAKAGLKTACGFMVTPGSTQIFHTIERDGQLADLQSIGGNVLANACGPCIGQWQRSDVKMGEANSIINSFNRPFKGRNDNNPGTHAFIASPEIVTAFALAGTLDFNPLTDSLTAADGTKFKLSEPTAEALPSRGFIADSQAVVSAKSLLNSESTDGANTCDLTVHDSSCASKHGPAPKVEVKVSPSSRRLQLLSPFAPWDGEDYLALPILLKAQGKCTTDHISPAGTEWLRYRGHLDNISNNMFSRVTNAFTGEVGTSINVVTGAKKEVNQVARDYKALEMGWVVIGDTNYGEGSSREHAAMSPRFLGCKVVIAKSFARIHRANLWKQGVLAFTFVHAEDYGRIVQGDRLTIHGLKQIGVGQNVEARLIHADGSVETIELSHGMQEEQMRWFKSGSFLNFVRDKAALAAKQEAVTQNVQSGQAQAAAQAKPSQGLVSRIWSWIKRVADAIAKY